MSHQKLSPVGRMVKRIVMALVDAPDAVHVMEVTSTMTTVLEVAVRPSDHGKAVGRGGRLAGAIREILACHSGKTQHRYCLEVLEGERPSEAPSSTADLQSWQTGNPVDDTAALLIELVRGLVTDAAAVRVTPVVGLQVAVFEIEVAPDDTRRIIGRGGRMATALRALLMSMGRRAGKTFVLEIAESPGLVG